MLLLYAWKVERQIHVAFNCAVDRHLHVLHVVEDARGIACADSEARSWRRVRLVVTWCIRGERPSVGPREGRVSYLVMYWKRIRYAREAVITLCAPPDYISQGCEDDCNGPPT